MTYNMTEVSDMPHAVNASEVATYFLHKAQSEGKSVTNKKLQKLLYYSQAWSIAARNTKLFDDKIEAWVHGPAIKSIYLKYKKFGAEPITQTISADEIKIIPADIQKFLDEIWRVYGKFDAAYLEQLTHTEDPWQKARDGLEAHVASENEITPESMKTFYLSVLKRANA